MIPGSINLIPETSNILFNGWRPCRRPAYFMPTVIMKIAYVHIQTDDERLWSVAVCDL